MADKVKLKVDLSIYGLKSKIFLPAPPKEIDELYHYVDDISGDGRGLD